MFKNDVIDKTICPILTVARSRPALTPLDAAVLALAALAAVAVLLVHAVGDQLAVRVRLSLVPAEL